jgi:transketolase
MKASRQSFGEAVTRLAASHPNIIVMDADLGKSTMTGEFQKKFPERYLEFGIAEHNLIGTAAGLALEGKIPFAASFACFLVTRYETIRMSVGYMNTNVRLVGTHAGVGVGEDGNSQMGLEDIALLRSLPNMTIIQPADDAETQAAIEWSLTHQGPVYFRLTRQKLPDLHPFRQRRRFVPKPQKKQRGCDIYDWRHGSQRIRGGQKISLNGPLHCCCQHSYA